MPPTGQRDYRGVRLTRHALDRFEERFGADPSSAEAELRQVLSRTRRLGRNAENGASAILAVYKGRALVAIFQEDSCLTVLTWPQFEPRLPEFGRRPSAEEARAVPEEADGAGVIGSKSSEVGDIASGSKSWKTPRPDFA